MSPEVEKKLKQKHNVMKSEVAECFDNRVRSYLTDNREEHKTDPPMKWFIALTDKDRELKVVFIYYPKDFLIDIRSAFPPNEIEKKVYADKSLALGT
jgi:hypothetical protein